MAPLSLYDASVLLLIRGQATLLDILKKASESAKADSFPSARLVDDMLPLTSQVQIASNTSKSLVERITGKTIGVWEDDEKTLPEAIARVEKTLEMLKALDPKEFEGIDDKELEVPMGKMGTFKMTATQYVLGYTLPNFFFHINTAYGILRANGVDIGKRDYLYNFISPYIAQA